MSATTELVDGQIYRWRWADPARDNAAPWGDYHCKSRIAIVASGGHLFDTYWNEPTFDHMIHASEVDLTFFCDQSWEVIPEWKIPYYDRADVADTRHANNSRAPIYLKPGATRSIAAIIEAIEWRENEARSEISSGQRYLERMAEARKLLSEDKIDEVYL